MPRPVILCLEAGTATQTESATAAATEANVSQADAVCNGIIFADETVTGPPSNERLAGVEGVTASKLEKVAGASELSPGEQQSLLSELSNELEACIDLHRRQIHGLLGRHLGPTSRVRSEGADLRAQIDSSFKVGLDAMDVGSSSDRGHLDLAKGTAGNILQKDSSADQRKQSRAILLADKLEHSSSKTYTTHLSLHEQPNIYKRLVTSNWFELVVMVMLLANFIFSALHADSRIRFTYRNIGRGQRFESSIWWVVFQGVLFVMFACEAILKLLAWRWDYLKFRRDDLGWLTRFSELVMLILSVLAAADLIEFHSVAWLRIVQVFSKSLPFLRVVGLYHVFGDLRLLIVAIAHSLACWAWAMFVLVFVMLAAAIAFVEGISSFLESTAPHDISSDLLLSVEGDWSSVWAAVLTEFKCITGGGPWGQVIAPISSAGVTYLGLFVMYIAITTVAMMRVVTGIFCGKAQKAATRDFQESVQQNVAHLFRHVDKDGSGTINKGEFQKHLQDATTRQYFDVLGIDQRHAQVLFDLLDKSGDGEIDISEFVAGCKDLGGQATNVDMCLALTMLSMISRHVSETTENARHF